MCLFVNWLVYHAVPKVNIVSDPQTREMIIKVEKEEDSPYPVEMCLQHEKNGVCKTWKEKTIPFHSVTPCMCFQVWFDRGDNDRSNRVQICPFTNNTEWYQRNVWDNVSVTVVQGQMNSGGTMLSWNLTAPCRLEGVVRLCQWDAVLDKVRCNKLKGSEQPMENDTWKEHDKYWLFLGAFENINTDLDQCVLVTVENREFGPFCPADTSWWHWRWSLLVLVSLMLFGLAAICLYFLHGKLKRLAWQWHQRKCNQIYRGRVVLLSPPETNTSVSELVCRLGSTLSARGHSVSVDMWSRAELCSLGPLPWLHSQLQPLDSQRARAILVLTRSAWQKAEDWAQQLDRQGRGMDQGGQGAERVEGEGDWLLRDPSSPYADVFSAALGCVEADRLQGRAGERFLLVQFEAHPAMPDGGKKGFPQLFQGLPVFDLPSQSQALFSALAIGPR
uniref:SEFIR domain-containing protein n=1 Tax=Esox lucius TaxID=8010 RepID=A0AAY5KDJ8_ESOLU